jgi:hypothetical protein
MSAAAKRAPEPAPTPFPSPERAALAAAIVAAAGADARRAALVKATATADDEVLAARRAVAAADQGIEVSKSNAARHLTDTALGVAGEPPQSIRQARATAIEAADNLEVCIAAREGLNAEQVDVHGLATLRVQDAAVAVLRAEMAGRGVALAARVAEMQRQLVAAGSALEWLAKEGVFREPGGRRGEADENIRRTVWRMMDSTPRQWATILEGPGAVPFAQPTGAQRWQAAFEALKRDANTPLPEDPT